MLLRIAACICCIAAIFRHPEFFQYMTLAALLGIAAGVHDLREKK